MPELNCSHFLPEDGDYSVFKHAVLGTTVIADVRHAIQRSLTAAGFTRVQVSKIIHHPVYEISLRRGTAMIEDTAAQIRRRIRQALKKEGLYKNAKENLLIISVQRYGIICGYHAAGQESAETLATMDL